MERSPTSRCRPSPGSCWLTGWGRIGWRRSSTTSRPTVWTRSWGRISSTPRSSRTPCDAPATDGESSTGTATGEKIVAAVPTWGPHPEVPDALVTIAKHYPLVILSNAADDQIHSNVDKLGAPFHAVCTAEQARAYKPQFQAFEYMLDTLGCDRSEILHVSSSLYYDLIPAHYLRITNKVYVNRGYEPSTPYYGYHEIEDLSGLPAILGL